MTIKTQILILVAVAVLFFFLGRQLTSIKVETKYEKVIDAEATKIAIAQATEKLRTEYKQVKIKETLKKPDGTIQISEKTETQEESKKEVTTVTRESETQKVHEVEKILVQAPQKNFTLELFSGIRPELPSLDKIPPFSIPDLNPHLSAKLSYRIDGNFWVFTNFEHQILNKRNYGGIGVSYRIDF
jgi:hypothetical protein